jgi:hypothetical protein
MPPLFPVEALAQAAADAVAAAVPASLRGIETPEFPKRPALGLVVPQPLHPVAGQLVALLAVRLEALKAADVAVAADVVGVEARIAELVEPELPDRLVTADGRRGLAFLLRAQGTGCGKQRE